MKHRYRIKLLVFILLCGFPAYGRMVIPDYGCFTEGLIDDIHPKGWLYECLQRQSDGLTGHPEALAYPYNTCLWAGEIERKNENPVAKDWWRYEQTAYYTDGLLRLGYLLDDKIEFFGVDISKRALQSASALDKKSTYAVASVTSLPFEDGYFDLIIKPFFPRFL